MLYINECVGINSVSSFKAKIFFATRVEQLRQFFLGSTNVERPSCILPLTTIIHVCVRRLEIEYYSFPFPFVTVSFCCFFFPINIHTTNFLCTIHIDETNAFIRATKRNLNIHILCALLAICGGSHQGNVVQKKKMMFFLPNF